MGKGGLLGSAGTAASGFAATAGTALSGVAASAGTALSGIAASAGGFLSTAGTALAGLAGPAGIAVAAVGAVGVGVKALWDNNEDFRNGMTNIWNGITSTVSNAVNGIKNAISNTVSYVSNCVSSVWNGVKSVASTAVSWGKVRMDRAGVLLNPYEFPSKPIIRAYGSGEAKLYVGSELITIQSIDGYVDLNCETHNAYNASGFCNNTIKSDDFPELLPGKNRISWTGGIDHLEITPRWWAL